MHPSLKKTSVNWIDGMKVNKDHFQQTEDWFIDHLKDIAALRLTDYKYGLLPPSDEVSSSADFQMEVEQTQFVKVTLLCCRAITRGGIRIEITPSISKLFSPEKNQIQVVFDLTSAANEQYDIVVTVDPYHRVPAGDPDPEEHPLRHPSSLPNYSVDVIPSRQVNSEEFSTYHLSLGRFRVVAGEVQTEDYIPPCTSINSHPTLTQLYRELEKILHDTDRHLTQYVKRNRALGKQAANQNVLALAERMLMNTATFYDEFQLELPYQSPIDLFKYCRRLVRLLSTELQCMPEDDRLVVYNILNQGLAAGTLENTITSVLNANYSHRDIYLVLNQLLRDMDQLGEIMIRLPLASSAAAYDAPRTQSPPSEPSSTEPSEPKKSGPKIFRGGQPIKR